MEQAECTNLPVHKKPSPGGDEECYPVGTLAALETIAFEALDVDGTIACRFFSNKKGIWLGEALSLPGLRGKSGFPLAASQFDRALYPSAPPHASSSLC